MLRFDGPSSHAVALFAAVAACHYGNPLDRGRLLIDLGDQRGMASDFAGAARDLTEALRLCRELGDRQGQATALIFLGDMRHSP
jgi:hypothetical protein